MLDQRPDQWGSFGPCFAQGDGQGMVDYYKQALRSYQGGQFSTALEQLHAQLAQPRSRSQDIYALLGNVCLRLSRLDEAADAFANGASMPGRNAPMLAKFAMDLSARTGNRARLATFGETAIRLHPNDRAMAFDYANALFGEGRYDLAAALAPKLDRSNPHHLALIINCFRLTGQFERLAEELETAHRREPGNPLITISRFAMAREMGNMEIVAEHDREMAGVSRANRPPLLDAEPAIARLFWAETDELTALANSDSNIVSAKPRTTTRRAISGEGRTLKIGYLSSDFLGHATMRLFDEVLDHHDRSRFEITLFCHTEPNQLQWQRDNLPRDLISGLVRVGEMSDEQAAAAISAAGIDILVDLKGHTMNARLGIMRLSDAPLKVTYLGYPGPVSGAEIDYAITDRVVTPDEAAPFFEETFCRLPETYQSNSSARRPLPPRLSRREAGLPEEGFVLASFNAIQKITPKSVALWAAVMQAVPGSHLWLLANRGSIRANLLRALSALGIAEERVIFAENMPYRDHVARLGAADLGLDTFPYNGHTTTSDMLWAGLPVLTLKGHAFQARVSESLLKAAGLDDMTATDGEDYVARAKALAADPARLAALKQHLEESRFTAPLFDTERFTRHLEAGYVAMADRARQGLAPTCLDIEALPVKGGPFLARARG